MGIIPTMYNKSCALHIRDDCGFEWDSLERWCMRRSRNLTLLVRCDLDDSPPSVVARRDGEGDRTRTANRRRVLVVVPPSPPRLPHPCARRSASDIKIREALAGACNIAREDLFSARLPAGCSPPLLFAAKRGGAGK